MFTYYINLKNKSYSLYHSLQVNDNGVISLNNPFLFWQPAPFPTLIQTVQSSNVFGVYWSDVDNRHSGRFSLCF